MRTYIAKRIILLFPSLLFVVLLSFILLHNSPGDPVERILNESGIYGGENTPGVNDESIRNKLTRELGLDLPVFYFSIQSLSEKETTAANIQAWKKYVPVISLNSNNQFHRWLFGDGTYSRGIVRGDFGISWRTHEKISSIIFSRIKWSVFFSLISVLLAYLISVPVGMKSASRPGSRFDRWTTIIFTILFSLPAFWVATLLMLLFCNPDVLNFLPTSGVGPTGGFPEESGTMYKVVHVLPYLVLPTICYTYGSLAFLSGSIKASVSDVLKEDYIRTAYAKGLGEKEILRRHVLRNVLLPMITIFSQVFPFAIGGSVLLETIFTIPGMGLSIYQSISSQDYPMIISVFMMTGVITMLSFLLSDILYAIADPRISYSSTALS